MGRKIRVTVQALVKKGQNLLVYTSYDKSKKKKFYRPIGGGVDFGETGAEAALREFFEESGLQICNPQSLGFLENIFTLDNVKGHELVQVFLCEFSDSKNYQRKRFPLNEGKQKLQDATWVSIKTLSNKGARFYPKGIKNLIRALG